MPELPEVEITRRGIEPHVVGQTVRSVSYHCPKLRWPLPIELPKLLARRKVLGVQRRSKYLMITFSHGTMLVHLGMTGTLRVLKTQLERHPHDHVEWQFTNGTTLRFRDPRKFGSVLWTADDPYQHHLLTKLGPEPLTDNFDGEYLYDQLHKRSIAIKPALMNAAIVVGVGNIYASESCHLTGIRPTRSCRRLSRRDCHRLAAAIKHVLARSIELGGTSIKDFTQADGKPGYFRNELNVYARDGQPCLSCDRGTIKKIVQGQRSTFYCPACQQ